MKHDPIDRVSATPADPPPDHDALFAEALAAELVAMTGILGELAYDLASHPETLRRHMTTLQAIDLLTQTQLAIAETLRSRQPVADRIAAITLESLADSLRMRIASAASFRAPHDSAPRPSDSFHP